MFYWGKPVLVALVDQLSANQVEMVEKAFA